jgi:hypothetical protein
VRPWLTALVQERGVSPWNLGEAGAEISALVDDTLHRLWQEVRGRYPSLNELDLPFRASLPWNRLFEVRIDL